MWVVLTVPVTFRDIDFNFVSIDADTAVFLDVNEGIAFYNDNHFFLDKSEYAVVN